MKIENQINEYIILAARNPGLPRNLIMPILENLPTARRILTFEEWNSINRQIKRGSHRIAFQYKNGYTINYFDVSQTQKMNTYFADTANESNKETYIIRKIDFAQLINGLQKQSGKKLKAPEQMTESQKYRLVGNYLAKMRQSDREEKEAVYTIRQDQITALALCALCKDIDTSKIDYWDLSVFLDQDGVVSVDTSEAEEGINGAYEIYEKAVISERQKEKEAEPVKMPPIPLAKLKRKKAPETEKRPSIQNYSIFDLIAESVAETATENAAASQVTAPEEQGKPAIEQQPIVRIKYGLTEADAAYAQFPSLCSGAVLDYKIAEEEFYQLNKICQARGEKIEFGLFISMPDSELQYSCQYTVGQSDVLTKFVAKDIDLFFETYKVEQDRKTEQDLDPVYKNILRIKEALLPYMQANTVLQTEEVPGDRTDSKDFNALPDCKYGKANYKLIERIFPDIISKKYSYEKFKKESFDDLSAEWIGPNRLAIALTYIKNSDVMRSPEYVVRIDHQNRTAVPLSWRLDDLGQYHEIFSNDAEGRYNRRLLKDLDSSLCDTLKELSVYDYLPDRAIDFEGKEIDLVKAQETATSSQEENDDVANFVLPHFSGNEHIFKVQDKELVLYKQSEHWCLTSIRNYGAYIQNATNVQKFPLETDIQSVIENNYGKIENAEDFAEYVKIIRRRHDEEVFEQRALPFYKRYTAVKNDYEDSILFTQVGDFYEVFGKDAETAAKVLGLTLTSRDCGLTERVPMVGIPVYVAEQYANKLNESGYNAAFISNDPKTGIKTYNRAKAPINETTAVTTENPIQHRGSVNDPGDENFDLKQVDLSELGGAKHRCNNNLEAIRLLKELQTENRAATEAERRVLSKYVGWGGLWQIFDENKGQWAKEYHELKNLLTEEEYASAKSSVLTAYYTDKAVVEGIYKGLKRLGLNSDNYRILEPACGTGNFIGYMPHDLSAKAKVTGIEIDGLTGLISQYLYPQADIKITGYESADLADNSFDIAVGNVPFGSFKVHDPRYNKLNYNIHDYYFAKTLDKVKAGGVIAFITTKGTMDKANPSVRKYIAQRAELLGAIRLPNTAFKKNAGTEITADILFLKKREYPLDDAAIEMQDIGEKWLNISTTPEGVPVNEYFAAHPEMLLGKMVSGKSMYGREGETSLQPDERTLERALNDAISFLPENAVQLTGAAEQVENVGKIPLDLSLKDYSHTIINGKVVQRRGNEMVEIDLSGKPKTYYGRIVGLIGLRRQVRKMIDMQLAGCSDEALLEAQRELTDLYETFHKQYGCINDAENERAFGNDSDRPLLLALEKNYDSNKKTAERGDIFTKRTIGMYKPVDKAENVFEALDITRNQEGRVNLRTIEKLTGKSYEEIIKELQGSIYRNPDTVNEDDRYSGWEIASEYLSGNVKRKLAKAKAFAERDDFYQVNVKALEAAQPKDIEAKDIKINIGAPWVDTKYYRQFLLEMFERQENYYTAQINIAYNVFDGSYKISAPTYLRSETIATKKYGTDRRNAVDLYEQLLNQQIASVYDMQTMPDGKERPVLNRAATIAAQQKQKEIARKFQEWIFEDPERRQVLVRRYNDLYNAEVVPEYNGDYLTFPQMNPNIKLDKHQRDAVARTIAGGSVLYHHEVGAGKTYTAIAAALKLKQYGIIKKPLFAVPNNLLMQWAEAFITLAPNANILVATKEDVAIKSNKKNREEFLAKVAMNDWDAVIITQPAFEKIPISIERQKKLIEEEIKSIEQCINQVRSQRGSGLEAMYSSNLTIKRLESTKKNRQQKLEKLLSGGTAKDDLLNFESLGVDFLFVDESQNFKNLSVHTKMRNVAGINTAESYRAEDMYAKCRYLNEYYHNTDKGVVFLSGTPISNSLIEMYVNMLYLRNNKLKEQGLNHLDAWVATYGETSNALELAPSGQGYRMRRRCRKFVNVPELMKFYRSFADVKTAKDLNLPLPKRKDILVELEPSEQVKLYQQDIVKRAERIHSGAVNAAEDNMLVVTSDGKKLALDARLYNRDKTQQYNYQAIDEPDSKVNACVRNVFERWKNTQEERSTQVIFLDISVPHKGKKEFNLYTDMKNKLVSMGVPESEIAFAQDFDTDKEKKELYNKMNEGKFRILFGSTQKCGAGANFQVRLKSLHRLVPPWCPSDIDQSDGRIVRRGNINEEVEILNYIKKGTFDAYLYQILAQKQKFVDQIIHGTCTAREVEDIDQRAMTYEEITAIAADNPKIKRKMELENRRSELEILWQSFREEKFALRTNIDQLNVHLKIQENILKGIEADIARNAGYSNDVFEIEIKGQKYTERPQAGEKLLQILEGAEVGEVVAQYHGFEIKAGGYAILLSGMAQHKSLIMARTEKEEEICDCATTVGTITKIENVIKGFEADLQKVKLEIERCQSELTVSREELAKDFSGKQELTQIDEEILQLNNELSLDKGDNDIAPEEGEIPVAGQSEKVIETKEGDKKEMPQQQESSHARQR